MKKKILIPAIIISSLLFSCAGEGSYENDMPLEIAGALKEAAYEEATEAGAEDMKAINDEIDVSSDRIQTIQRKLIKTGSISFETENCIKTKDVIKLATKKLNGYLSNDNSYDYGDRIQHSITVRIPSENFDKLLDELTQSISELDDKNISVSDVTEEFVDVEARLKAKKAVEKRYLDLLNKAYSVGDILQIENELARLREQIEATEGRLRFLKDQVGLSTLTISYYQITEEGFGFGKKVGKGFENGWKGLLWFFIGLINLWPFILFISIGVWLLVRWIKRKSKK